MKFEYILSILALLFTLAACGGSPSSPIHTNSENHKIVIQDEDGGVIVIDMNPESIKKQSYDRDLTVIDQILATLEFGNIVFNPPEKMNIDETRQIQLLLGMKETIEQLKQMIEEKGIKDGDRIRVSDRMEARLTGLNFNILAITPEEQGITRTEITKWKWEIKPKSGGQQELHLTLAALIDVYGETTRRSIRVFDKKIDVEVTLSQRIYLFFKDYLIEILLAAVLLPGGLLWFFWDNWNKSKSKSHEV
ncbi:MAG: hypothetical protein H6937_06260 [Burkholderiales bacterium]|nr:hypothetical protein [Burkholderiales bacterium]MDR4515945.1 hypothetical protein [Nitrosomonas sp.]